MNTLDPDQNNWVSLYNEIRRMVEHTDKTRAKLHSSYIRTYDNFVVRRKKHLVTHMHSGYIDTLHAESSIAFILS